MIVDPVIIVGAPRSGTSLLQKVLRNHPAFWSLPSESELIWDKYCHPGLRGWDSECLDENELTEKDHEAILKMFESFIRPAGYWDVYEKKNLIWGFRRLPFIRKILRTVYKHVFPLLTHSSDSNIEKRLLEKTISNCFRLGYVNAVFPSAKIIYTVRDGRNNVNSLINTWRDETRFFSYDVPEALTISGLNHQRWKFVLPPKWRDYTNASLAEICAFQWRSCHEALLNETEKDKYSGRVMRLKLEDLAQDPAKQLSAIADFINVPYDDYFQSIAKNMPVINSTDNNISNDKWQGQNRHMIEEVMPMIKPTMKKLGYEL